MSYDPDRTTVLPSTPSEYPITDELPAVQVRSGESWLVRLSLLAVVIAIGVGGFFAANPRTKSPLPFRPWPSQAGGRS